MNVTKATSPTVRLDADDTLRGRVPAAGSTDGPGRVSITYNGKHWATVPTAATQGTSGPELEFACRLAPVAKSERAVVEVRDPSSGKVLAKLDVGSREPLQSQLGLSAHAVYSTAHPP